MMTKNNDKHSIKEKNKKENLISLLTEKITFALERPDSRSWLMANYRLLIVV